jgi:hypothetical protein
LLQVVSTAQEISAKLGQIVRLAVVQTNDEQRRIDYREAFRIVLVGIQDLLPQVGPDLSILCRQKTDRVLSDFQSRCLIAIFHDSFEVLEDFFIVEKGPVLRVKAVEPVYRS